MTEDLPDSFPSELRVKALDLFESARAKGWLVGVVRVTGDQANPIISVTGRAADGSGFFFSSGQAEFIERLTTLISR